MEENPLLMFSEMMFQMSSSFIHPLYRTVGEPWEVLWYFSQACRKVLKTVTSQPVERINLLDWIRFGKMNVK